MSAATRAVAVGATGAVKLCQNESCSFSPRAKSTCTVKKLRNCRTSYLKFENGMFWINFRIYVLELYADCYRHNIMPIFPKAAGRGHETLHSCSEPILAILKKRKEERKTIRDIAT